MGEKVYGTVEGTNKIIDITPFATNDFTELNTKLSIDIYDVLGAGTSIIVEEGPKAQMLSKYHILDNQITSDKGIVIIPTGKLFGVRTMGYTTEGDLFTLFIPGLKTKYNISNDIENLSQPGFEVLKD